MNAAALKAKIRIIIALGAIITLTGVISPPRPAMPANLIDASWQYAMNEAVARHLTFGKDIVFTYGPYSFVYSQSYDPATDRLMVLASLFLALCYILLFLSLAQTANPLLVIAFLLYAAAFLYARDALIFSYPLLLVAAFTRRFENTARVESGARDILSALLLFAPLGLLSLIKGTYLMLSVITVVWISSYLILRRRFALASICLFCPAASTIVLWKLAGQKISALPGFFESILPIIAGYTEAMASNLGDTMEIAAFLATSALIVIAIARAKAMNRESRMFISSYLVLFLFLVFKSSFVRHDSHAAIAGSSLLMAALIVAMLSIDAAMLVALSLAVLTWLYIDEIHTVTSADVVFDRLRSVYVDPWTYPPFSGARSHLVDVEYKRALASIRRKAPVPALKGTVDAYPTDQSAVLASNNQWNPRPVFQSYSAYTPKLAGMNEAHLRTDAAPDNILFSVQPIDDHLPSLEDGLSWPALFDNYQLVRLAGETALLRRNASLHAASRYIPIDESIHKTGDAVPIAGGGAPVFAEVILEPTPLGKLLGAMFKYPQLHMTVSLVNGTSKTYRVLANTMRCGFILSPLVEDTKDFTLLLNQDAVFIRRNAVRSILITPDSGSGTIWEPTYTLKLRSYQTY